jgi:SAM-dependent methyltransferase
MYIRKLFSHSLSSITKGKGRKYCHACNNSVPFFIPHPRFLLNQKLHKDLQVIGSDLVNYMCPVCHSHDRERHLFIFLKKTNLFNELNGARILHFAPEKHLSAQINSLNPDVYIQADLYPDSNGIEKVDMQNIPYNDNTFDLIIANHVLEHVEDDSAALREIYRVLRHGGKALLQTPFSNLLEKTIDDPGISTVYLRTVINGQADHLRLYGRDIFEKVESFGFTLYDQPSNKELLASIDSNKYGINRHEPFMLFVKNQKSS